VFDPIFGPQERLIYAHALIYPPTLRRRTLSNLYPYAAVERASTPMSPVPEPGCRSLGAVPLPPWVQALLVQRLPADLQRSDPDPAPSEQAVMRILDSGDLPVVPVVFVATHCPRVGGP